MLSVDLAMARRLELAHAWRAIEYARACRASCSDTVAIAPIAGGYAVCSGVGLPVNRAIGLGLDAPVTPSELDHVASFFHSHGMVARVDLCPLADPSLLDLLRARGYRLEGIHSVLFGLVSDVAAAADRTRASPEVRVRKVGPEERELWLRTAAQGFAESEEPSTDVYRVLAPNFDSAIAICFLASVRGEPAGAGAMVVHEGAAEFCSDSTRPSFRNHGVQTALLRTRLDAAREEGCDVALALTTPGTVSQRNMERVGLRLAYTKVEMVEDIVDLPHAGHS